MERTIAEEENNQSGSSNYVGKSARSSVKIDSICIDLSDVSRVQTDVGKCEHFSIREYVSEIRSKDWRKCWPFPLEDSQNRSEEKKGKLPPLHVPKFRWWGCKTCQHEAGVQGIAKEETAVASNGNKSKSCGTCSYVSSQGEDTVRLSSQQAAYFNNLELRTIDATASVAVNSNDHHPSLCRDKGDKNAETQNALIRGDASNLEDNMNEEVSFSNCGVKEVISGAMQQTCHADDLVACRSNCNGFLETDKLPDLKNHNVTAVELTDTKVNDMVKNASETFPIGKQTPLHGQQMEIVKACDTRGVAEKNSSMPRAVKNHTSKQSSLELDEYDHASSETAERLSGTASGGSHRRKTRKMRLLTDLLGKNGDEKDDLTVVEGSPSGAIPDASLGLGSLSSLQGQESVQGNTLNIMGPSKKRKLPSDEEWKPVEMSNTNNNLKKTRAFNRGAGSSDAIANSNLEGVVSRDGPETGARSYLINFKVNGSPVVGKKKNKKAQNFNACLSLNPPGENEKREILENTGNADKSNAADSILFKSENAAYGGRGMYPFLSAVQKTEKRSSLSKKKNKMPQDHDGHAFPFPGNDSMLRECLTSENNVEIRQIGSVTVPLTRRENPLSDKGPHFSFNNGLPTHISPIRDDLSSFYPWNEGILKEGDAVRKNLKMDFVGDSSFSSKSELDAYPCDGVHAEHNRERTTCRMQILNEKLKKHSFQAEVGSCSLPQVDYGGTSNKGKAKVNGEQSAVSRQCSDQRAEMVSEQGALDDIPMEIVELMAKNQYERCLPDTESETQLMESTKNARNHEILDLNQAYVNGELSLLQEESTQKPKPQATNGRIGNFSRADSVGSTRQKAIDFFSHADRNRYNNQLEQSYVPPGFRPFPQNGEQPTNGTQFSSTSSSRQSSAQNCRWIGNMVGQRSSHTSMQALGMCNVCHNGPRQSKEAAHLWSSIVSSHVPFIRGMPQKYSDQLTKRDLLSHFPNSLPKGNIDDERSFLNLNASSLDKQTRKFDPEALRRTHADKPPTCNHNGMGSLDLYSNETIPAMHLLSLMDAGLQSGAPINMDGKQQFLKRTSFLDDSHSKEFPGLPSEGHKTTNAIKLPPYNCYGKNQLPNNFHEYLQVGPTDGASTSSLQHDTSFKKAIDFTHRFSPKSQEKQKSIFADAQIQNRNHRSQKIPSSSVGLSTTCGSIPAHSMTELALGTSDFVSFPIQSHAIENAIKDNLETHTTSDTVSTRKKSSETEICRINRNPADCSIPEAGNIFMIKGEDLRFGTPGRCGNRSGLLKPVGQKRQKKLTAAKEHLRGRTS